MGTELKYIKTSKIQLSIYLCRHSLCKHIKTKNINIYTLHMNTKIKELLHCAYAQKHSPVHGGRAVSGIHLSLTSGG